MEVIIRGIASYVSECIRGEQTGFSFNANGQIPTDGYMVGTGKFEHVFDSDSPRDMIISHIKDMFEVMSNIPMDAFIGGWSSEDGKCIVELSICERDKNEALKMAAKWGQIAIYDIQNQKDITCKS